MSGGDGPYKPPTVIEAHAFLQNILRGGVLSEADDVNEAFASVVGGCLPDLIQQLMGGSILVEHNATAATVSANEEGSPANILMAFLTRKASDVAYIAFNKPQGDAREATILLSNGYEGHTEYPDNFFETRCAYGISVVHNRFSSTRSIRLQHGNRWRRRRQRGARRWVF